MHSIGQVLYVVLTKKNQVYPMQVIEVITKKTLQGEEVRYLLRAGSSAETTVFLDQIDGEVFDTADEVRTVLTKRATSVVNKLVSTAVKKSNEWYGTDASSPETTQSIDDLPELTTRLEAQVSSDVSTIVLPDGTIAKVKMPAI